MLPMSTCPTETHTQSHYTLIHMACMETLLYAHMLWTPSHGYNGPHLPLRHICKHIHCALKSTPGPLLPTHPYPHSHTPQGDSQNPQRHTPIGLVHTTQHIHSMHCCCAPSGLSLSHTHSHTHCPAQAAALSYTTLFHSHVVHFPPPAMGTCSRPSSPGPPVH